MKTNTELMQTVYPFELRRSLFIACRDENRLDELTNLYRKRHDDVNLDYKKVEDQLDRTCKNCEPERFNELVSEYNELESQMIDLSHFTEEVQHWDYYDMHRDEAVN